ncbi:MAG: putative glycoside hydrolase [Deltaproteobacteria bacterium]|nr:putative glycoside hydrolase [Deltaproteobacteria bacterium]
MKKAVLWSVAPLSAALLAVLTLRAQWRTPPPPAPTHAASEAPAAVAPPARNKRASLNTEVRGLYVTSWIAGMNRFREIADGVAGSALNALVIDVKDCTGRVGYDSALPFVAAIGAHERRIRDLDGVLRYCQERKIHTIARIAVFQDPVLARARPDLAIRAPGGAIWTDRKGLSWVDPSSRTVWEYNVGLAKEAASRGFDEVQFDYVRFPTDGKLSNLVYPLWKSDAPKHEVIKAFFQYLDRELKPVDVLVSADIFGLTVLAEDDLNIGQRIEDLAPYVDYLCPMVYPSHFPPGYLGFKKPAEQPYRVIYDSCVRGLERIRGQRAKLRPWIQDFDLGAVYDEKMVLAQIRALRDAGAFGFCVWNARNVYSMAAYNDPLPRPSANPPFRATLVAELERKRLAKATRALLPAAAPARTVPNPPKRRV